MRVDEVPLLLRPAFEAYGFGAGALLVGLTGLIRRTCTFDYAERASVEGPRIECIWHEHLPAYIARYLPPPPGRRVAWMNHPRWYMRPIHVLLRGRGVERVILGSTGHDGQGALDGVIACLREGFSTGVAVDGPAGPPHVAKRGALAMALGSGRPLVAIRFDYDDAWRGSSWDHKAFPVPGSRIRVTETGPIFVTEDNLDESRAALVLGLGAPRGEDRAGVR